MLSRKRGTASISLGDGWRNADAAACQHWRPGCSAPTDTVVRGRSDTVEQSHDVDDDVKKGKVFPYSFPSVGPGADPGVQAVSSQVT